VRDRRCLGRDDALDEFGAVFERGLDDPRALAHEEPFCVARASIAQQRAYPPDVRVMGAERFGQRSIGCQAASSEPRAASTSAPNAAGSRTARSARILRSTCTSAALRPA